MRNEDRKKQADRRRQDTDGAQHVRGRGSSILPVGAAALPVFTHSLSVTLHCCSGASVVVVKGDRKTAVPPLGVLVLGTGGPNILLLLSVLKVVVVAALLVKRAGCAEVLAGGGRVARAEAAGVRRDGLAVESWDEAVVVSWGGGRGDT